MSLVIKKANKGSSRLRLALVGPAGAGKTYTALALAKRLSQRLGTGRICVIDTERGSASKYSDEFDFDTIELNESHHPQLYLEAIDAASNAGYDVIVIDSLSHAWVGREGALELVTEASKKSTSGNKFTAWKDVTPLQNALTDRIIGCKAHVIATLRAKTEYVLQTNERGKTVPVKVGLAPVQREGLDHEFDVVIDISTDHVGTVTKTRCRRIADRTFERPGEKLADELAEWLTTGVVAELPIRESGAVRPQEPTAPVDVAPSAPGPSKPVSNSRFIEACEAERKRVGGDAFDELLHSWVGSTDLNAMTDREIQRSFYVAVKKLPTAKGVDPLMARISS